MLLETNGSVNLADVWLASLDNDGPALTFTPRAEPGPDLLDLELKPSAKGQCNTIELDETEPESISKSENSTPEGDAVQVPNEAQHALPGNDKHPFDAAQDSPKADAGSTSLLTADQRKALTILVGLATDHLAGKGSGFKPPALRKALQRWLDELPTEGDAGGFSDTVTPIATFLAREYSTTYLVEGVLPAGQICIAGGPEKGQKSNLLDDMAISLAMGRPWLNRFAVPRPVKVLLLTGETQGANLQNIFGRIMQARGITEADLADRLVIKEELPTLDKPDDLATLRRILERERPEVCILDPLYFALGSTDPHLLTSVGQTVAKACKTCIQAGATPVFAHHMSKTAQMRRGEEQEPMQLADLNGAGFGPVAGSWLLVNYLKAYDPNTGSCTLWLNVGGRAGHGGLYTLKIAEGVFDAGKPLNGRKWHVEVQGGQQAIQTAEQLKADQQKVKKDAKVKQKDAEHEQLMEQIRKWLVEREPHGAIQSMIADKFGIQPRVVKKLLADMLDRLWVVRAKTQPGDNPHAYRWRSPGPIPSGKIADQLRAGKFFEDVAPGGQQSQQ